MERKKWQYLRKAPFKLKSMQPAQRLNHSLHFLYVARAHLRHDILLQARITGQELLNKLAIHESIWRVGGTNKRTEGSELVEGQVAQRVHLTGDGVLEGH